LYCPAGVKSRLPSGANARRRKNEVKVSLAYMGAFLTPSPDKLGEFDGITAGRGIEGAGETERRMDGEEPNDERRLCDVGGGFIGRANELGVPGADGTGDPAPIIAPSDTKWALPEKSGGAGLVEDILRAGRSIFVTLLCCASENCPSLFFRV
jgi:hypothetical protein